MEGRQRNGDGQVFFRSVQMKERKGATRKWKRLVSLPSNASKIKTNAYTSSFVPSNARIIETKAYTSSFVPSNACAGAHQIPFIHFSICTSVHFSIRLVSLTFLFCSNIFYFLFNVYFPGSPWTSDCPRSQGSDDIIYTHYCTHKPKN